MSEMEGFGGGPFGDLMKNLARLFTSQGPVNWEIANQLAQWTATGGEPESNVDPSARMNLEELIRVAEMHVSGETGLGSASEILKAQSVTRGAWANETLRAWKPYLEKLAVTMSPPQSEPESGSSAPDPMSELMGNLPQVLGPFMFGMQAGSMVGQLAQRSLGQYDLPVPRPASDSVMLIQPSIDAFAEEWDLPREDVRLWVCLREVTFHMVLDRPHVRARLEELINEYVEAFQPDPSVLERHLSEFDPSDMESLQAAMADPERLLGEMQTDEQKRLQVPLRSLLSAVAGYVDYVMDTTGKKLIGSYSPLTEALRRRRLDETGGTRILGRLLGVVLDEGDYKRGRSFVDGVLERAGSDGLQRLWGSERELPTPAEVEAPGLWLARIDLPEELDH